MKSTRRLIIAVLILTSLFALSACSARLMWVGNRGSHSLEASFASFNGSESKTLKIDAPADLALEYNVTLSKGELALELYHPDGDLIWQKDMNASTSGQESIALPDEGHYLLVINGAWASGDYQVSWIND
mgnify:FL=1